MDAMKPPAAVIGLRAVYVLSAGLTLVILATILPYLGALSTNGGWDYQLYMEATSRWLGGGSFYEPHQVAGPYEVAHGDILYPPVGLWLFVPFTVLPVFLWWAIPLGVTAWSVWKLRPGPLGWPLIALCIAWQPTLIKLESGNPVMWAMAAMSLGVVYVGPAVFVLLKPTLAPFALWGIRHRRWWLYLAALVVLSVPFASLWLDWLSTVLNARGGGILYSWQEAPMLLLPVAAWWARARLD